MVTSTPGEACGINRATTLSGKLWKKPWATSSSPQRQLRYQHALDDDTGTPTAPLTWLLSHQESTWLSAETLTPHGSDHLLVVLAYKGQLRSKTASHITPSGMKGRVQTLCQNCASGNRHKARTAHGKARCSHHGGTVRPRKLGQKNVPQ